MKCQRCNYEWDYNGKSEWVTSCPKCRTSVTIKKAALPQEAYPSTK